MPANRTIFITGATGFLGSELVKELANSSESYDIYGLVRNLGGDKIENVKKIKGDITKTNLGMTKKDFDGLVSTVDTIYHLAAITDLNASIDTLRHVNVGGTVNILDFAMLCKARGRLKKVNHISTAYVAGTLCQKKCRVMEDDLNVERNFNNGYEQTKREAEACVARYRDKGLDIDIFRPSIILGRYSDGMTASFKMLYQPIHFFSLELFDRMPKPAYDVGNLINLDTAAQAICLISTTSKRENVNYHITSPKTVSLEYVLNIASEYFGFKKPEFVSAKNFDINREFTPVKRKMVEPYASYFSYGAEFDMTNTLSALGESGFAFPEFDKTNFIRLFKYCDETGFIRRKKHAVIG